MALERIFEQPNNPTPTNTKNIAFGGAGVITENMTIAELVAYMQANLTFTTPTLNTTVVNIGNWDMDTTASVSIAHGLILADIRSINVVIIEDGTNAFYDLVSRNGVVVGSINQINITSVSLSRVGLAWFDSSLFNNPSFNRGYIVIQHV